MIIALPYIGENPLSRKFLEYWQHKYAASGTSLSCVMITDRKTSIPVFWKHETVRIINDEPPCQSHLFHKIGWLRSQAFDYLGKCVVVDFDAIVEKRLDSLFDEYCNKPIWMCNSYRPIIYREWVEIGIRMNAGVIMFNSADMGVLFRNIYEFKWSALQHIPTMEEIIFTYLCNKFGGVLPMQYNWSHKLPVNDQIVIHHFHAPSGKEKLKKAIL